MVIQSTTVTNYFKTIFEADWAVGETPSPALPVTHPTLIGEKIQPKILPDYPSHTDLQVTNFTGTFNVTLFTNPDCADEVIFKYLKAAKQSVYVSMYTISDLSSIIL